MSTTNILTLISPDEETRAQYSQMTHPKSHDQNICVSCEYTSFLDHPDNISERFAFSYIYLKGFALFLLKENYATTRPTVRESALVLESQTCYDAPDGFHQRSKARHFWLSVLPHRLPYNQPTGQPKGEVRFLGTEKTYILQLVCIREFVIFHRPFLDRLALPNTLLSVSRQTNDPVNATNRMEITVACFMENEINQMQFQKKRGIHKSLFCLKRGRSVYFHSLGRSLHAWLKCHSS